MTLSPQDKILRARIQLQKQAYFIYTILFYAKYRIASEEDKKMMSCPTAAADIKGNIIVHPDFIKDKDDGFVKAILYHEAMHLVLMHPILNKGRIPELWNICADIKANQYVKEAGHTLPQTDCIMDYRNNFTMGDIVIESCHIKSAIQIYNELYDALNAKGKITRVFIQRLKEDQSLDHHEWGKILGGFGDGDEDKQPDSEELRQIKQNMKDRVRQAYQAAQTRGEMPGGLKRLVGDLLESKLPWQIIVEKIITSVMPHEPSYRLPHKKSFGTGIYMPHIEKESADVIVTFDTSGSMKQDDLSMSISECVGMARKCHNIRMTAIVCDAKIQNIYIINNGNVDKIRKIVMKGGGGTSHIPVYEYCKKHRGNAQLIINFTDGYTQFPKAEDVNIPTLWVITKNGINPERIPFGKVIKM